MQVGKLPLAYLVIAMGLAFNDHRLDQSRYIQIGDPNETAAKNVTQHVIWTTDSNKRKALQELLENREIEPPLMIFMNMKKVIIYPAADLADCKDRKNLLRFCDSNVSWEFSENPEMFL